MALAGKHRSILLLLVALFGVVAITWAQAGRGRPPVSAQADDYFGNSAGRLGLSTDALIESLQNRLRAEPEDWQAYSQLGLAYLQKARESGDPANYQKAGEALHRALSFEPDDYTSLSAVGSLELARHQFQTALEWGQRALKINPDRTYAYGVVTDAQIELGQYEEAVQTLQTMADLRPDMNSYTRISYLRELHGDLEGALEAMQWAVESGSSNKENTAWIRTQLGNLYFNMGRLEQAEAEYQNTLQMAPSYAYALAGLGRVRFAQNKTEEAISLLAQASQILPQPEFIIHLGEVYQAAGREREAQQQYALLGAIQKLYQANGVDMDLEIALFNADHGIDLEHTLAQARQSYAGRPSIYAADVLAWALYQTGQYEEAWTYAQKALSLGSKDALKLFHAGMICHRLGEEQKAAGYLEAALAANPYFSVLYAPVAQQTLEELAARP